MYTLSGTSSNLSSSRPICWRSGQTRLVFRGDRSGLLCGCCCGCGWRCASASCCARRRASRRASPFPCAKYSSLVSGTASVCPRQCPPALGCISCPQALGCISSSGSIHSPAGFFRLCVKRKRLFTSLSRGVLISVFTKFGCARSHLATASSCDTGDLVSPVTGCLQPNVLSSINRSLHAFKAACIEVVQRNTGAAATGAAGAASATGAIAGAAARAATPRPSKPRKPRRLMASSSSSTMF